MSNIGPIDDKKMQRLADISQAVGHEFALRGKKIRVDETGFVSLNDIHKAAGFKTKKRPYEWQRNPTTNPLIIATYERVTGKSRKVYRVSDVYRATAEGTWAHPMLAAAYAGYLKPELEVEMREVWLRFKSADATLADEILERATDEENEWAATRAMGRAKRGEFTKTLDDHGVEGYGYATCTDAVYMELFDANAKKLKESRGLSKSAKLRDAMSKDELVYIMMAETLAKGRIKDESPNGNGPCAQSTKRSAYFVRQAIEADKNDRQKPLDL